MRIQRRRRRRIRHDCPSPTPRRLLTSTPANDSRTRQCGGLVSRHASCAPRLIAPKRRCSVCRYRISTIPCKPFLARSTSVSTTSLAGSGRSLCRPSRNTAKGPRTSTISLSARKTARWCRFPPL